MSDNPIPKPSRTKSLSAQITEVEQQLMFRQQRLNASSVKLIGNIHQQITAPATLLLTGGIGFILGELTQCPAPKSSDSGYADSPAQSKTTPLSRLLTFKNSAQTLYSMLPLALIILDNLISNE